MLPVVAKTQAAIAADTSLNHEYLPVTGNPKFTVASVGLLLGEDSAAVSSKRVRAQGARTGSEHVGCITYLFTGCWCADAVRYRRSAPRR